MLTGGLQNWHFLECARASNGISAPVSPTTHVGKPWDGNQPDAQKKKWPLETPSAVLQHYSKLIGSSAAWIRYLYLSVFLPRLRNKTTLHCRVGLSCSRVAPCTLHGERIGSGTSRFCIRQGARGPGGRLCLVLVQTCGHCPIQMPGLEQTGPLACLLVT